MTSEKDAQHDFPPGSGRASPAPTPEEKKDVEKSPPENQGPSKPAPGPGPIPDGGVQAWLQVAGGFSLFFNTWGLINAFGVYQTYYESGALFSETSSNIAWIGAVQSYLLLMVGFLSGPIYDRGYFRPLLAVGSFCIVFGIMMLSLCTTYWQALLAQGFCIGIGAGCLYVPCVAILPSYFSTRLGLAVGLAVSGSSLGGIVYPIVLYRLIGSIGFPWAVRVTGFIALATLSVPVAVMKMRVKPARPRSLIDWAAFADAQFMLFTLAALVGFIGLFVVVFYISFYALDRRILDTSMAFYLVPIFNAASCFGRTVPNALSDKVGPFNLLAPGAVITGVLVLTIIPVDSEPSIIVLALLAGFFTGLFIALPPICFVALTKDRSKIGTRMGMGFGLSAFGILAGGPGGGAILGEKDPLQWHGLWVFGGVSFCVAGLLCGVLRVARSGWKLNVKA